MKLKQTKRNETTPGGVIDMKLNHIELTDE